ncbi:bifunctional precorrin-2 dehydrogenase/sirohydrochlorin ferrochelatase [Facklamia sp. DSM 111018]|uniref:precorrin-2 dehydrogenase n=1 Tax=Facklamia lactis TaxID=2749967 RepID=A0ABS0LNY7_9LACT|nr:bifunctional precorrin-2 dehydrogenase/sirohydrochlorin ferrochelatase [Facklamia lactis]MBG9979508.1 bifunctional precorrin-2 dehydrogenase/sirohydrochlorin ferrochelatase [Facklamia lactis]MBG9985822.1 bifunctional precorrin-2 dehydrogenase/sirohydrochlorin ferrochelatase [Facklamia lactis]
MYPVLLNLSNKSVLVVGGGKVASRKIKALLENNAKITVISPELNQAIDRNQIHWIPRKFKLEDGKNFDLIFACTDDPRLNSAIYERAEVGQFVNNASDKEHSDFYNMKVIESNDYLFSVSSLGKDYRNTKKIGNNLKHWLDHHFNQLLK